MKTLAFVLTTFVSGAAFAADSLPTGGEAGAESVQQKAKFNEIERGFSFRLPVGVMAYLTPVTSSAGAFSKRYTPGLSIGLELGYDILPFLDIGGFFYYSHVYGVDGEPRRDLNTGLGGLMARISFFHTERFYLGARVGGGYGFQITSVEPLQHGFGAILAITAEYFTRIRHFSIALDVTGMWLPMGGQLGQVALAVTPAIRYTF